MFEDVRVSVRSLAGVVSSPTVKAIASGSVGRAAELVENALAKAVPLIIGLLASLLGISGLAQRVKQIIMGVRKRIDTPKGRVRTGHVVLAGGAHLGSVFRAISESLLPVSSYMAVTAPLGERLADAIRYRGSVSDTRRGGDYYRIVEGDRLLWGSRISTRISTPRGLGSTM